MLLNTRKLLRGILGTSAGESASGGLGELMRPECEFWLFHEYGEDSIGRVRSTVMGDGTRPDFGGTGGRGDDPKFCHSQNTNHPGGAREAYRTRCVS